MSWSLRTLGVAVATASAALTHSMFFADKSRDNFCDENGNCEVGEPLNLPSRDALIEKVKSKTVDVLVIGGGATGSGVALDAVSRGLDVVMVEQDDFGSGTSSRSTKLIHGGVRYLEKAVLGLDLEQFQLVEEALSERETLLRIAPHIANELPIIVPIYRWWELPYLWAGIKAYDFVAWMSKKKEDVGVSSSFMLTKSETLQRFPQLNREGLKGSIVYHDGQHDDAGMTLAIALTAVNKGAVALNHTKVVKLLKEGPEDHAFVCGAEVEDVVTGEHYSIRAKCVINATGCFTQGVLHMDDPSGENVVEPSQGLHIILPDYFCPKDMGMLEPSSSDGRVLFFLPWMGRVIAGTTDSPTSVTTLPQPNQEDVEFVVAELNKKLSKDVHIRPEDVRAAWSGIRPLVRKPGSKSTEDLPRTHFVYVSESGLVTIAGGKWTTYRQMAEDTVDAALKHHPSITPHYPSQTKKIFLVGGERYTPTLAFRLVQQYDISLEMAEHLASRYGDKAFHVIDIDPTLKPLTPSFPNTENEVIYAVRHEYAQTAVDVLARRTRLAFLDNKAATQALEKVVAIMAKELNWNKQRISKEKEESVAFLKTMTI